MNCVATVSVSSSAPSGSTLVRGRPADLLLRLAQRRLQKARVARIHAPARKADLAAVRADVVGALGEDQGRTLALHDRHQHRRLHQGAADDHAALARGEAPARARDQLGRRH